MRLMPVITAIIVCIALYFLVFERDTLLGFAGREATVAAETAANTAGDEASEASETAQSALPDGTVRVLAQKSFAQEIDSAVILRGQTEALRQVDVRAETAGKVVSEPLRRGSFVEEGQLLCAVDAGTRAVSLQEAMARLAEANTRVPEARARLSEAEAQLPATKARIAEAKANVPAAEARLREAQAALPSAELNLDEARSRVPESAARVMEAEARVREAEINLNTAQELAKDGFASETRVVSEEAALESARAQLQSSKSGESSAKAAIQAAISQIEGAKAAVESAASSVEGARAAVISAEAQLEGALAGIEAAKAGEANALSAIQSAEAQVAAANKDIERLEITAPFAGLLETDTAELGSLLQAGSSCATVIQLNPIKLVGFVPETEVGRVNDGALAGARLVDGREVTGVVTFISRSADTLTRTFRVEIEVPNDDLSIRDGQTAEIGISADGAKAHLLPQSTLTLSNEGELGVRVIDEASNALFMPVTLLRDTADGVWLAGLPEQVDVITVGQEYVTDGVPVAPTFEEILQ